MAMLSSHLPAHTVTSLPGKSLYSVWCSLTCHLNICSSELGSVTQFLPCDLGADLLRAWRVLGRSRGGRREPHWEQRDGDWASPPPGSGRPSWGEAQVTRCWWGDEWRSASQEHVQQTYRPRTWWNTRLLFKVLMFGLISDLYICLSSISCREKWYLFQHEGLIRPQQLN